MEIYMEPHQIKKYRYERKYTIEKNQLYKLITELYNNKFYSLYDSRRINNIYFDTHDFNAVTENIEGLSRRVKKRVRWYGPSFENSKKNLEIKIKNEFLNRKEKYKLGDFKIPDYSSISGFDKLLRQKLNDYKCIYENELTSLKPTLFNSYDRCYYFNSFSNIRLTIDENLSYYSPITKVKYYERKVIIEAKFDKDNNFVNNFSNLNLNRYSKYAQGIIQTTFHNAIY